MKASVTYRRSKQQQQQREADTYVKGAVGPSAGIAALRCSGVGGIGWRTIVQRVRAERVAEVL
jgi:hypothetical protein